nr:MAG TPA: Large Terminase [Caudoviricetes sp.]
MASRGNSKDTFQKWQRWCETVQTRSAVTVSETPAQKEKRIKWLLADYGRFFAHYLSHYCTDPETGKVTECAPFHIKAAHTLRDNPNIQYAAQWARGHAKSVHFDVGIPLYLKALGKMHLMVLVGKSADNARTLLGDIQAELEFNQRYIADFGTQKVDGSWMNGEFVTADGCAFFARGRGQSPRGLRYRSHRPDYIVIDDLDDDELVNNPDRVNRLTKWLKEALFGTLDGGRGRFVMVGNLIGKCSVLANFLKSDGVVVSKVNAIDSKGRPSWAAKWSIEEIRKQEAFMGYISFQREMMNNPIHEGSIFRNEWIRWCDPLPLARYDHLVCYCDPSFKSSSSNDYKAIKLWGKTGTDLHCLAAFVRQCSVAEMVRWFYDTYERVTAAGATCLWYIEANFLQDTLLDEFTREGKLRGYQLPISPDRRKKPDKFQRIEGISPLWERGFVFYNRKMLHDPDMKVGIDQTLSFEHGMTGHDDGPDADEGAIYKLQLMTREESFPPALGRRRSYKNIW